MSLNRCPCLDKSMFCTVTLWIVWRGNALYNDLTFTANYRDAISDTSEGYPDMASALGVKLTPLEDKMPFAVSWHSYDKTNPMIYLAVLDV